MGCVGRCRGRQGRGRRLRASGPDSTGGEGDEVEAEVMAASICSKTSSVAGNLEGTAAAMVNLRLDLGFGGERRKRERAEQREGVRHDLRRGGPPYPPGAGGERHGAGAWRQWPCRHSEKRKGERS